MPYSPIGYQSNSSGLFQAARYVSPGEVDWGGRGWAASDSCPSGGVWECDDGTVDPIKAEANAPTTDYFKPFNAYQVTGCKAGTSLAARRSIREDAARHLSMNLEGWISAGLEVGTGAGSPAMTNFTDLTPAGGAVPVATGVSMLLRYRTLSGIFDRPTIHVPTFASPGWKVAPNVAAVTNIVWGPGYGVLLPSQPASNEAWLYITGLVEFTLDAFPVFAGQETLDEYRKNHVSGLEEILANRRFGPCGNFRIRVRTCDV